MNKLKTKNFSSTLFRLGLSMMVLLIFTTPVCADVETADVASGYFKHQFSLGYRYVDDNGNPVRTREYDFLENSVTGAAEIAVVDDWGHLNLDAQFLNQKDFDAQLHVETGPTLALSLYTTSLFHNLDHLDYVNRPDAWKWNDATQPPPPLQTPPLATDPQEPYVDFSDQNPTDVYGVQSQLSEARAKVKMGDYPAHINLKYWSFERSGTRQQRYLNEDCTACHLNSQTRPVDQTVEEFSASVDGHIGAIDVIAEQVFREFTNHEETPSDTFGDHLRQRTAGDYQHDDEPNVRYRATTLKLHSSLSGGVNLAASGTYGKRENESDVSDVYNPVRGNLGAETEFVKAAGDVNWTPSRLLTVNSRYRYLDMDFTNPDQVKSDGNFSNNPIDVRDSIDKTVQSALASFSLHPSAKWKIKAEGEWRDIDRKTTDPTTGTEMWHVPEDETHVRGKLGIYGKSQNGRTVKVQGWIQYEDANDPAYDASFDTSRTAFVGLDFSPSASFGFGVNGKYEKSKQNNFLIVEEEGATPLPFDRDREQDLISATCMAWIHPASGVEIGAHYGYLQTSTKQDVIFGTDLVSSSGQTFLVPGTSTATDFVIEAEDAEFDQTVHTASAQLNWHFLKNWSTRLEGRLIQSKSEFAPEFAAEVLGYDQQDISGNIIPAGFPTTVSANGLTEISKVDILQTGGSAALNWDATDSVRVGLNYTFDRYDDRRSEALDGTVQTYMASVAKRW